MHNIYVHLCKSISRLYYTSTSTYYLHNINLTNVEFKLTYERNVLFHSLLNQGRIHHAKIVFLPADEVD